MLHPQPIRVPNRQPLSDTEALRRRFPTGFQWGVATSSFQIEGASRAQGKGESIWDRFCRVPGVIADASDGDVACDHFNRLESDLDLIAWLGVDVYRFSMSWPRVQPQGKGGWNEQGFSFYERLVDGLLQRGVQPCLTLNHWDLPQAIQDHGGWNARDTVHRFTDYAREVNRRLGDRLKLMTTHNEPWVISILGHEQGIFAPGIRSRRVALQVAHHLLLSHGLAVQALRADGGCRDLGIVLNLGHVEPASDDPQDVQAARACEGWNRRWYTDPLFKGQYPAPFLASLGADAPHIEEGDMKLISQPIDHLGINYYTRSVCQADGEFDVRSSGLALTDMGWEVYPQGLSELLCLLHREYELPAVWINENGAAFPDTHRTDRVHDADRVAYLQEHIAAVADAVDHGVPVAGYMVWSLMDNFEWASGYAKRFGIVEVDYRTFKRTPKDSALWYRAFLGRRAES
jgi:beta-glucosidase